MWRCLAKCLLGFPADGGDSYGYLGYTTLQTYDSQACANKCNKINGCISFNIYFERDPTVDPGTGNSGCANPPSTTQIKCVFWGGPVDTDNALNVGQWRNQFQVVIAGSNGYVNNTVAQVPGYGMANPLGHAAINAPYDAYGFDSYMGSAMFVGAFDAQLCADACTQKSNYAIAHPPTDGTPVQTCQFFNTYILYINTTKNIQGQVCAMYSESWPASYATNVGQYRGNDHFLLEYSFSYSNATNPGSTNPVAAVYQAKKDILWPANSAQPYCSSILGYTTPLTTSTVFATATTTTTTTATTVTTQGARVAAGKRAPMAGMDLAPRDSVAIPNVLTKYPASIVTSACSLAVTPVTQTSVVLTTTTATTVPATTTTTTTVTTSPAAVPTHAIVEIAQTDGYNWWGVSDVPCNNDESAYLLEGYPGAEYGDTFQLLGPGQPITVVSTNVNAPDVGDTMYYDPTNAFYGPAGGAGVASFLTAVSSSDSNTASTLPINCSVDGNGNLQCLWANTGVNGDWWFCRGIVTLVAPGHDLSQNAECQEGLVYKLLNLEWQGTN